jgi:biopolymer transport protein ExbD
MAKKFEAADVDINMTPMIDCTFQLIIFFILTTRMVDANLAAMKVHRPEASIARKGQTERPDKVIINIVNEYGNEDRDRDPAIAAVADAYVVSGTRFDLSQIDQLKEALVERKQEAELAGYAEDFHVEIRADKDITYANIRPVLWAARDAGLVKMSMTALVDPDIAVSE